MADGTTTRQRLEDALTPNVDMSEITREVTQQFQEQIDTIRRIADNNRARAEFRGRDDLGRNRARSARGGLTGSVIGDRHRSDVQDVNEQRQEQIDLQEQSQMAGVQNLINQSIAARAQGEQGQAQQTFASNMGQFNRSAILQAMEQGATSPQEAFTYLEGLVPIEDIEAVIQEGAGPESFNLSQGQARFVYNPSTGRYERVAFNPRQFAPQSEGGGGRGF